MDYQSFQPNGQEQNQVPNLSDRLMPYRWHIAIIGGIIIALLFGAYSYLNYTNQQNDAMVAKQAQDAQKKIDEIRQKRGQDTTSTWKTYTNTQYGFEFKYPGELIETNNTDKVSFSLDLRDYDSKLVLSFIIGLDTKQVKTIAAKIKNSGIKEGMQIGNRVSYFDCRFSCDENNITNSTSLVIYDFPTEGQAVFIGYGNNNSTLARQVLSTFKFTNKTETQGDLTPVIYSVTPSSGPIGTKITIKGKNLNGFEGDLNARIATEFNPADYSSGIMYGERNGSTDTIVPTIQSSFCKQDNSYSGLPCKSYFYVTPGLYEISVKPWSKESNSVPFAVTASP